jgi:hypothetical protein
VVLHRSLRNDEVLDKGGVGGEGGEGGEGGGQGGGGGS